MIHRNMVWLQNVAELCSEKGEFSSWDGQRMQRVPESLRTQLNEEAGERMLDPSGMELRFVANGPVHITLSLQEVMPHDREVCHVYRGDLAQKETYTLGRKPTILTISPDPAIEIMRQRLEVMALDPRTTHRMMPEFSFSPSVTRLRLPIGHGPVRIYDVTPDPGVTCRPPRTDEMPGKTLLAYGTSITQGASASAAHLNYASHLARRLGMDLINLGSGGSCHCEEILADYIADIGLQDAWDVCTLALSVNMQGFEQAVFRRRVAYMIERVSETNPTKPVFAITLWPYFRDVGVIPRWAQENEQRHGWTKIADIPILATRMRQDLRDAVTDARAKGRHNLHLLEGPDHFGPFSGNTTDLIHPSDEGMFEIGLRLADAILPHLPK